jgi:very-short-patch-repair endonuclease
MSPSPKTNDKDSGKFTLSGNSPTKNRIQNGLDATSNRSGQTVDRRGTPTTSNANPSELSSNTKHEDNLREDKPVLPSDSSIPKKPTFESPIEGMFWEAWQEQGGANILDLTYQYQIKDMPYRVDFAHLPSKTAIELDGHDYHSSKEQLRRDKKRERDLARHGWRVIRYTGSDIYANPAYCFKEVLEIIKTNNPKVRLGRHTYVARHRAQIVERLRLKMRDRQWGDVGAYKTSDEMTLEEMYAVAAKDIAGISSADPKVSEVWKAWLDRLEKREQGESL